MLAVGQIIKSTNIDSLEIMWHDLLWDCKWISLRNGDERSSYGMRVLIGGEIYN